MLIPLASLVLGAALGAISARMRGGQTADMLQWGAVFGLIFGILGLFITIFILRAAG